MVFIYTDALLFFTLCIHSILLQNPNHNIGKNYNNNKKKKLKGH